MLTNISIKALKPKEKQYRILDSEGLYILISPKGTKSFQFRYKWNKKDAILKLGKYPYLSLSDARKERDKYKEALERGNNPKVKVGDSDLFKHVAKDWFDNKKNQWSKKNAEVNHLRMNYAIIELGNIPINDITAINVITLIQKIQNTGKLETARRVLNVTSQIFRYALILDVAKADVTYGVVSVLQKAEVKNHAFLRSPQDISDLMYCVDNYNGSEAVRCGLKLFALTFVRSQELRLAKWNEIEGDLWRIPKNRMKTKGEHLVPLSTQAVAIFDRLRLINGDKEYIFASNFNKSRALSGDSFLLALKKMDFTGRMSIHGFRHLASTQLNEQGYDGDAIELQLAHTTGGVRSVYNKATKLDYRRKMLQGWADWLDGLG